MSESRPIIPDTASDVDVPSLERVTESKDAGLITGPLMRLVRVGWVLLAINTLWTFGWTLYYTWEFANIPPPRVAAGLAGLGVSNLLYALISIVPLILLFLSYFCVALLLFVRLPNDRMALFTAVFLMGFSAANAYPPAPEFTWFLTLDNAHYTIPFLINSLLAWPLLVAFFALYPDGVFVPRWMRWVAGYGFLFSIAWSFAPQAFAAPTGLFQVFVSVSLLVVYGGILVAQVIRYRSYSTQLQRQQTRWMVAALTAIALALIIPSVVIGTAWTSDIAPVEGVRVELIYAPLSLAFALLPLAVGIAIFRYRLYNIDIIIRRTLIYGTLVGGLAVAYFGGVALLQLLSVALTGPQSNLVVVLITLALVALFNPVRLRFQTWIDRAFYREKVDSQAAFTAFAREVRTVIELPALLRLLVERTTDLLHITHGAVFLREADRSFNMAAARDGEELPPLHLSDELLARLEAGHVIAQPKDQVFPLLVPLIAPAAHAETSAAGVEMLVGVLALGPRLSDQQYTRDAETLLLGLADQAGTAIYVAQLIAARQAEAERRAATERQLEARRNSPIGQAEAAAQALLDDPSPFATLHMLGNRAGEDPAAARLLEHLPRAIGVLVHPRAPLLMGLADGFNYLVAGESSPELLTVGLRTLVEQLERPEAADLPESAVALGFYTLCRQSLEVGSIGQITALAAAERPLPAAVLADLTHTLAELSGVVEALRAYERVDTIQDKLAYLVGAIERLSRVDRQARADLGAADRPIALRIAETWLAIITGAMGDLQTRAQIGCTLLTRHTWTGEVIALALAIRNSGRGAALGLNISLAPAPEYTQLDEVAFIEQLAAGEETQVTLRVRPRLAVGADIFRARFLIRYADPRGPDQVEHFADEVRLLAAAEPFQFIPNPYVVGTPLQEGSPLFFGRGDLLNYIAENLAAAHRNNLVLIGQRRTGKTSLLKQLPARLGDDYLPVYLDGQSLGLDPGLPNFFLALATEIAFALDDRGFSIDPPDLSDFTSSPASAFERGFLARVRDAIGARHILLLLDEFEELEGAVRRGSLDASIFGFLRHLIQHSDNLSVIFCGTHRLEELAADYWSVLFNISLYRHVGFLERAEAERLIRDPVSPFGMRYDDLALEKIWRVTAGHPYFLQLLCHSLVNRHNKSERGYTTIADVNAALDEILASGEAHFVYLWAESGEEERLVLSSLSRLMPITGHATPAQVGDYLAERGVAVERRAVAAALHRLALRDILTTAGDGDVAQGDSYRWKLGLLGLWVEKYRSLSRVVSEARV